MFVADEGVAAVMGCWWFGWWGGSRTAPTSGWMVAWMERVGCVGGLVGVPRSAPGPHPNPLPSNGRGGCLRRMSVLLR